jgi:clan AA aspartic protease (TIGR02281 family)
MAASAHAEIYRWTDAEGRLHFTERIEQVPPEHRDAARRAAESRPFGADRVHSYSGSTDSAPAAPSTALRGPRGQSREIVIPFVRVGSLMRVEAMVNDFVRVPFLIDTGASGVSIPSSYAEKLGMRIRPDMPHVQVTTANGVVARPVIVLRSVEVEGARVENLSATVNPAMDVGLLGGDFFNNYIYRVDAAKSVMTLVPNEEIRGGLSPDQWRARFRSWTDPLDRLDAHVRDHPYLSAGERAELATRQSELEAGLDELERHADQLGVPKNWRR